MRRLGLGALWLAAGAVVVAFFLPWIEIRWSTPEAVQMVAPDGREAPLGRVTLEIHRPGQEAMTLDTAALASLPRHVSGAALPFVLRRSDVRAALAVGELWRGDPPGWEQQSGLIYAVPFLIVLLGCAATWGPRPLAGAAALLCALTAASCALRTSSLPITTSYVTVHVGPGIWMTIVGYGVAACAAGIATIEHKGRG